MAEVALVELVDVFGHRPDVPIHIVLTDETDTPNGFAETLPYDVVTIFAAVPPVHSTLGDYDDFLYLLVAHELVHIVHIDTVLGVPRWVNAVLGKTFVPNSVQPRWVIEGIATWLESRMTSGGRVRSSYVDLLVRTQVLAGQFPDIDRLSHFTRTFPGSSYSWFLGGRFIDFIARRHGAAAIGAISRAYGARPIPYAINLVAKRVTGETFIELFEAWRAEERQRALAVLERVESSGPVLGEPLARESPLVEFPRFAPNGRLAIIESPRDDDSELVVLAPDLETELLRLRTNDGRGAFTPDGERYVATIIDTVDFVYSHRDLEVIDVATGRRRRRTLGWRLSEPDVAPDGETIVAVAQEAGRTRLVTLTIDGDDDPVTLDVLEEEEQVYDPRWSPDGRAIVATVRTGEDGGRNLVVFDLEGGRRALTRGATRRYSPVWSNDGSKVFHASDDDGVFDIERVDVQTKTIERLTNVVSGALQPAVHPDGERLFFVHGTPTGWELRHIDLPAPPLAFAAPKLRATVTTTVSPAVYPDVDYDGWEGMLPKAWIPALSSDGVGEAVGVVLSGSDPIRQHLWALTLRYGLESERLGFDFSYANRQTPWPLSLSTTLTTTTRPGILAPATPDEDRVQTVFRARAGVSFPLSYWDSGHALSLSYGVETRRGTSLVGHDPFVPAPRYGVDLTLASLSLSWSFSNVRGYAESVSPARGQAFGLSTRLHSPSLGSDLRVFDVIANWTGYLSLPWLKHHVLASRVSMGAAAGDTAGRSFFVLGGLPIRNVVTDAIEGVGFGIDIIRGYERAIFRGSAYYLGTLAYRFPVTSITEGWATLPLYLDRLHAEVFVDAGNTFVDELAAPKVGIGAELRLDLAVAYVQPYTLRLGYGRGLAEEGRDNVYLVLGGIF